MIRFKSFTHSPQAVLFPAILLIATFCAACGGAKQNSASDSAPASSASSSSSSGGGDFEGEITAKMFTDAQPMEIRYATKGSRMRAQMQLSTSGPQMDAILMDFSSGTQTMLFSQNKTYVTMNLSEMAGEMTKEAGKDSSGDFPKVTPTGKTETIAGLTCQHWLIGDKQDTDVCMAKGLGYFAGGGGGGGGILDQLKNLALREKIKAQLDANPEFAKFVEGGAFPLKVAHIENGQSKTILEVTSVERKSLDDSLFTVPAGYKKMEFPGMPGAKQ
ncbi:MAG: DUF4412 domain-containing protein [Blastocatellia bacterium]